MVRSRCNDIETIYKKYGIEATRQILLNEFQITYEYSSITINYNQLAVLVDQMCHLGEVISIDRHGISKIENDTISKASFEKTMDHFINAAIYNEIDTIKSVSSSIAVGRVIPGGTGSFDLLLDIAKLEQSEYNIGDTFGRISFIQLEEDPIMNDIIKYNNYSTNFILPQ
jgi:DNA-directed RNA polymerase II subunit RPB1